MSRMFSHFFQHGYVTTDMARAKSLFAEQYGVTSYLEFDNGSDFRTPRGVEHAELKIALAFVGDLQIELIQPLGGPAVELYREVLPAQGFGVLLHHLGFMVPGPLSAWQEFRAGVGNTAYPLALEGDLGFVKFVYVDTRPSTGHYCEYIWAEHDIHGNVPHN